MQLFDKIYDFIPQLMMKFTFFPLKVFDGIPLPFFLWLIDEICEYFCDCSMKVVIFFLSDWPKFKKLFMTKFTHLTKFLVLFWRFTSDLWSRKNCWLIKYMEIYQKTDKLLSCLLNHTHWNAANSMQPGYDTFTKMIRWE